MYRRRDRFSFAGRYSILDVATEMNFNKSHRTFSADGGALSFALSRRRACMHDTHVFVVSVGFHCVGPMYIIVVNFSNKICTYNAGKLTVGKLRQLHVAHEKLSIFKVKSRSIYNLVNIYQTPSMQATSRKRKKYTSRLAMPVVTYFILHSYELYTCRTGDFQFIALIHGSYCTISCMFIRCRVHHSVYRPSVYIG